MENTAVLGTETEQVTGSETQPNAAEQKPAAAPGTQPEGDDEHDQPGKEGGWQRVKRQRDQARQDADYWRAEALKHQRATQPPPAAAAPAVVEEPEPKSADFATTEGFLTAIRAWDRKQILKDVKADLSKTEQQKADERREQERAATYQEKATAFAAENPDFSDVIDNSKSPCSPAMRRVIDESDIAPALVYYLAKNEAEAQRIFAIKDEMLAAVAMGKIEASLAKEPTLAADGGNPAPPPISKAPTPINPIRKTSSVSGKPDPLSAAAPQIEFEKEMNKRQFGK